jgi:hypothetical protein
LTTKLLSKFWPGWRVGDAICVGRIELTLIAKVAGALRVIMSNEPIIALLHKNHAETGRVGRQYTVLAPEKIIEADHQYSCGADDFDLLFDELHLIAVPTTTFKYRSMASLPIVSVLLRVASRIASSVKSFAVVTLSLAS